MENVHKPVMVAEAVRYLQLKPNDNVIDATLGGGGHAQVFLEKIGPNGKLLGIDLDQNAIQITAEKTKQFQNRIILVHDNFKNLTTIIMRNSFKPVHGILLDLGLSSNQLQDHQRGFSFLSTGRLDMRFGSSASFTAEEILQRWSVQDLTEVFKDYGEERLAKPIAEAIVKQRSHQPIRTAQQLVDIIAPLYRKFYRRASTTNPATKIFQALRIAVNDELASLEAVLPQAVQALTKGGRLMVMSYHSLEDRIVKNFFHREVRDCICPPQLPTCQCNHKKTLMIITKKPLTPTADEINDNSRSRSAKVRVAQKL